MFALFLPGRFQYRDIFLCWSFLHTYVLHCILDGSCRKNKRINGVGVSNFLHGDTQPLPLFAPRVAVQVFEDIFPSFALLGYVFAKRGVVFYLGTLLMAARATI